MGAKENRRRKRKRRQEAARLERRLVEKVAKALLPAPKSDIFYDRNSFNNIIWIDETMNVKDINDLLKKA